MVKVFIREIVGGGAVGLWRTYSLLVRICAVITREG